MQDSHPERKHGRILWESVNMGKKTNRKSTAPGIKRTVQEPRKSTAGEKVIWRFDKIGRAGKFAFDVHRADFKHCEVMEKMIAYSNMTWQEIGQQTHDQGKSKHHFLSVESLSKEAVDRFEAMQLEEYSDAVFSFALQNKLRIIGLREEAHFHVLWYDPGHEVCPSRKKHT